MLETLPLKGIYTLIVFLETPSRVRISGRGWFNLKKGYYAYTGSALGNGAVGLRRRVARHLRRTKTKYWHIDYLLASEKARVTAVIACSATTSKECQISRSIQSLDGAAVPIDGFGASDCKQRCRSHLAYCGESNATEEIVAVYKRISKKASVVRAALYSREKQTGGKSAGNS